MTIGTPNAERVPVDFQVVSPGYFEVLRIPIVRGRGFDQRDRGSAAPVAIVSDTLVRRAFGNRDPIGQRITLASPLPPATIVGVVGEIMRDGPAARLSPQVYLPAAQSGDNTDRLAEVGVLADGDPLVLVPEMQRLVASIDANLPITHARKLDDILDGATAPRRFNLLLLGALAMLAVTLALVGVYGVVAHAATERRKEIGIRIALGAVTRDVTGLFLRQGLLLAGIGIAIGLVTAGFATRVMTSLLFGVRALDPLTYVAVALALGVTALLASYVPAARAARVAPAEALRREL
jgi:predicted permease